MRIPVSILLMVCFTLLTSCEYKILCYDHNHGMPVQVNVDWSRFTEEVPTGMTAVAYPESGGDPVEHSSHDIHAVELNLREGRHQILVYNQSPSEFAYITFRNMDNYAAAEVGSVTKTKSWYSSSKDEFVAGEPEWFASGTTQDFEVTRNMLLQSKLPESRTVSPATVYPETRIYTVSIRVHVDGIQNLYSIRGSLSGMAEGCQIATGKPTEDFVTLLLESWTKDSEKADATQGVLNCQIRSFGLTDSHSMEQGENILKLSVLLADKQTIKDYVFKVGDRFEFNTDMDLKLDLEVGTDEDGGPIELPDVKPAEGSGFDVNVDEWNDPQIIEIPI